MVLQLFNAIVHGLSLFVFALVIAFVIALLSGWPKQKSNQQSSINKKNNMKNLTLTITFLISLFLNASGQNLPKAEVSAFDNVEKITFANHISFLPKDYRLHIQNQGLYSYSNGTDFVVFNFDRTTFISVSTTNPSIAGNPDKFGYNDVFAKNQWVKIYNFKGKLINETLTPYGAKKWVFYSVKYGLNALANNPNKYQ